MQNCQDQQEKRKPVPHTQWLMAPDGFVKLTCLEAITR
jgi:hypothetical protein